MDVRLAKEVTEIGSYDAVVVGSPILYGKWRSEARKFLERHQDALSRKGVYGVAHALVREDGARQVNRVEKPLRLGLR